MKRVLVLLLFLLRLGCALADGPASERDEAAAIRYAREAHAAATAAYESGDAEEAQRLLAGALAEPNLPLVWSNYLRIYSAEIGRFQERFEVALDLVDATERTLGDSPDDRKWGCYLSALRALIYLDLGLLDLANRSSQEALARLERVPPSAGHERRFAPFAAALVCMAREDYDQLHEVVTTALEGAPELYEEAPAERAKLLMYLGLGWKELARFDRSLIERARGTLREALAEESLGPPDRVQPELGLAELAAYERDWSSFEEWMTAAEQHLAAFERPQESRMFATYLILRCRAAVARDADADTLRGAREALKDVLRAKVARWSERRERAGGYGLLQFTDQSGLLGEIVHLTLLLEPPGEAETRALEALLAFQDEGSLVRRIGRVTTDVRSLRSRLVRTSGHGMLIYFPAPERTHLFLVDAKSVRHVELLPKDLIERARKDFELALRRLTGAGSGTRAAFRAQFDGARERLQGMLLPNEARATVEGWGRCTVAGENRIGELPFEAFLGSDGRPLGVTRALDHLPSASVGVALAERSGHVRRAGETVALFASTSLNVVGEDELLLDEEALAQMLAGYAEESTSVAVDAGADLAAVRSACSSARVVQFFTHGSYDLAEERPALFELAGDPIGCDEVETWNTPVLVLLTVCGSGIAPERRGDPGAASLIGAFLQGGRARCVVASSFDLEVEATRRLSTSFHAGIARGASPAEAMRAAREALVADERFAGPQYYALMQVVGLGQEPIFER